ncbi:MAG: universal stress protein [Acidobacteria bacterium]|nr:universal stress protein [Acidobacteriota bacterium]
MKILIAYDGSHCAESALDDLVRAGLPSEGEVLVVTVAEVWLPPPESTEQIDEFVEELLAKHREKGKRLMNEAEIKARHAAARIKRTLPGWTVKHLATYGSASWEILTAADELNPELIIVGSHGHSVLGRLLLGSVSQKVLTEAKSSVRIARGRVEVDPAPGRIMVGFDGSNGANAAVETVRQRKWADGTMVRLVAATDSVVPTAIGRFIPSVSDWADDESKLEHMWIEQLLQKAAATLAGTNLSVETQIVEGNPNDILVREAEKWHADCIFVGANAYGSRLERFLLGSTSSAVASRAACSVEVIRLPAK